MVATPIGNLADIGLRALHLLHLADTVACEDTRNTQTLLRSYGIEKSGPQWLALHQHNEAQASASVVERLRQGQRVVYVSDAGTPGVSDPGARLVAEVRAGGFAVSPVPGPSSITAALSAAGLVNAHGFVFDGFCPTRTQERDEAVLRWAQEKRAIVLLEAPHRIEALAQALAQLGARPLTVARELTKRFEEVATVPADAFLPWLQANSLRQKGEFVLVLHPDEGAAPADDDARVLALLLAELPLKTAVRLAVDLTGRPRNVLYDKALALKAQSG